MDILLANSLVDSLSMLSELGMTTEAVSKAVGITAAAVVRAAQRGESLAIVRALSLEE